MSDHDFEKRILEVLLNTLEECPDIWDNRWDVLNFCIGYFGSVTASHINVINYLARQGYITD